MTFRDNNTEMLDIIDKAANAFNDTRTSFVLKVKARQLELQDLVSYLKNLASKENLVYCTFPDEYMNLFTTTFTKVDSAFSKILNDGAMTKDNFLEIGTDKVGVDSTPIETGPTVLWDRDTGSHVKPDVPYTFTGTNGLVNPTKTIFENWYEFSVRYAPTRGGLDYGNLFFYDPDKMFGPGGMYPTPDVPYEEDTKCWGPFTLHGNGQPNSTYAFMINMVDQKYGGVRWSSWEEDPIWFAYLPELPEGALKRRRVHSYVAPNNFSPEFKAILDKDALLIKDDHAEEHYAYFEDEGGHTCKLYTMKKGDLVSTSTLTYRGKLYFLEMSPIATIKDTDPSSPSYNCSIVKYTNKLEPTFDFVSPNLLWSIYQNSSDSNIFKFDFTRLLAGTFGKESITTGLENQVKRQTRTSNDTTKAMCVLDLLANGATYDTTPAGMRDKISDYKALIQLAYLYAVKFAIARIFYGHIHRVSK